MMLTYKALGLIIIGMILFQSCDFNRNKDFKAKTEKRITKITHLDNKKFIFIEYEKVVSELKTNMNFESGENKYDLIFILLLDSTEKTLIKRFKGNLIEEFRNYSPGLQFNERTVGFYTEKSDIKEIFTDNTIHKRIIECVHTEDNPDVKMLSINETVYVKGNKAIFEISGPIWSDTYFARLNNNTIQINWLGGVIQ